jgi:hypothetical protein
LTVMTGMGGLATGVEDFVPPTSVTDAKNPCSS